MSKVFISFDYSDVESLRAVENWKNQGLGRDISLSSEVEKGYPNQEAIKEVLRKRINDCYLVLVLVGQNTHNRPWIDYEISYAKSIGLKILWTQIPNTDGGPPKELTGQPSIPFRLQEIQEAIRLR